MPKLTWNDFERCASNIKSDFEDLARVFFKVKFFNGDAIFSQSPNNAGVEIMPIKFGIDYISFQAKHFDNQVDYSQIEQSILAATRHYNSSQLNIIYLFCNKDLTLTCTSYLGIEKIANDAGMKIVPICNNAILDEVTTNDAYENIKHCFFGGIKLNKTWFDEKLKLALEELGGRYDKDFNVDIPLQRYFEFFLESNGMLEIIEELLENFLKKSKKLSSKIDASIRNEIGVLANSLEAPERAGIRDVLEWHKNFTDIKAKVEKIKATYDYHAESDGKKADEKREKYFAYSEVDQLLEIIDPRYGLLEHDYDVLAPVSVINNKVIFLEGGAGSGKSHLLGHVANTHKDASRIILLLGQKLINDNDPWTQIRQQLDLSCEMQVFLNALECKGAIDNTVTTIIIDAINESANKQVWKKYLNSMVIAVSKLSFVKLVCSVRSTYIDAVFDDMVKQKKDSGEIFVLQHRGFEDDAINAMNLFFAKYGVPSHYVSYLPQEFSNPLLLKLFCQTFDNNTDFDKLDYASMFDKLVEKENSLIKDELGLDGKFNYVKQIIDLLVVKMIESRSNRVPRQQLAGLTIEQQKVLSKMMNGQVLYSYYSDFKNDEILYFRYEKMGDFLIAQNIIANHKDKLHEFVEERLLISYSFDKKRDATRGFVDSGIAGAIFAMLNPTEQSNFAKFILSLDGKKYEYLSNMLIEMIASFSFMKSSDIDADVFSQLMGDVFKKYPYKKLIETYYNVLITNSGKVNNPLNSNFLTNHLKPKTLVDRDYLWTIYVNKLYDKGSRIYNTVNSILKNNVSLDGEAKFLLAQQLCWFLTASNRVLRDEVSRALAKLLIGDIEMMKTLLCIFADVNDPYIIQRLFGVIYGAILSADRSRISKKLYTELVKQIFDVIFNQKTVYPDILLRDYALNIIEYAACLDVKIDFDIKKCRPTYKSKPIPKKIDKDKIFAEYEAGEREFGLYAIKSSMSPDAGGYYYGDFGRYIFQQALEDFEDVDITHAFHCALDFIKNELGYKTEYFNDFDSEAGHGRVNSSRMERIGKKYQWITMYNFLARIADHNKYKKQEYTDATFDAYKGTWRPYVRDFDPTLDLIKNERVYEFDFSINQPRFSKWDLTDENWAERSDDGTLDFEQIVELVDSRGEKWVALKSSVRDKSSKNYESDYQDVWKGIDAYLIKSEQFDFFAEHIAKRHFHGRWMPENREDYKIFCGEYCWSPAYHDENSDKFRSVELDLGKKKVIKQKRYAWSSFLQSLSTETLQKLIDGADGNEVNTQPLLPNIEKKDEYEEYEEEVIDYESIGEILPCWNSYLWEEEFDFAKEEAISIDFPIGLIMSSLNLNQMQNGVFTLNGEVVCVDFSLVKGNADGLYIKKKVIDEFLQKKGLMMFWACMGEKFDKKKNDRKSKFFVMSSFVHYDKDGKLISVSKHQDRDS